ncbi:MAG: SpoVG family protein [Patescibacteria group bacterium]|nr:SpoVG family protein [Patescibacteria group bacterium]
MQISDIHIDLVDDASYVRAYVTVTFDGVFVIHDAKVVDGRKGLFLAFPSRKLMDNCPSCRGKNVLMAGFCNYCGSKLASGRVWIDEQGNEKLYVDICHPIDKSFRTYVQNEVLRTYQERHWLAKAAALSSSKPTLFVSGVICSGLQV